MTSPPVSTRRLALLSGLALLGVLGAVSVCNAESPWRRRFRPGPPPPYRVTLEDAYGAALPTFSQGDARFVLGAPGERYNVRVDNPTAERVEVVVTVDGRDAVSGELGDYVTQRGYLIEAYGSLLVEGFRRSMEEVAAFRFTDRAESYSARRGTPRNVGVVGVAVFPERARPKQVRRGPRLPSARGREEAPRPERREGASFGSRGSSPDAARPTPPSEPPRAELFSRRDIEAPASKRKGGPSNIGTEYGEDRSSSVVEVAFERRSPTHPAALLDVRYDDYDGLVARGVDVSSLGYAARHTDADADPDPFPRSSRRFAPPPRR